MVLIQRGAYVDLVQGGVIDIAISPNKRRFRRCSPMYAAPILSMCRHYDAAPLKQLKRLRTVMRQRPKWLAGQLAI